MPLKRHIGAVLAGCFGLLAACAELGPRGPATAPLDVAPPKPQEVSDRSKALSTYFLRLQSDLLSQGLLRTDGGGPDTPFTATGLSRNFETIAFYDEYERGAGLRDAREGPGALRRWGVPVRFGVVFGTSVPEEQRRIDRANVRAYAKRMARVTGHPMSLTEGNANFHVLFMGEDDRDQMLTRVQQIVPNINQATMSILRDIPRSIHCLVIAFSANGNDSDYRKAIALVRAEHPDLLRKSCIHEELAQGLGLANDSPRARPSIFNDDDEFALLTTHDEMLLRILYDRRLRAGMSLEQAQPLIRQIAGELAGGGS
ncbi:MAG: DUF2927 domain-containing protein [Thalassovita sp.]|nr:DUF2927 domain-containing protein [Thalassovita sp.]